MDYIVDIPTTSPLRKKDIDECVKLAITKKCKWFLLLRDLTKILISI